MPQHILDLKKIKEMMAQKELSAPSSLPPSLTKPSTPVASPIHPETPAEKDVSALMAWETEEYEYRQKGPRWFFALAGATLAVAAIAVYLANYFFAAFVVVAGVLLGWFARKEPRRVQFVITEEGVALERRLYLFDDLKSFWIFYDPPLFKELTLESKKTFMPRLTVPLGDTSPERVRETLRKFLNEEKQQESMLSLISKLIGF